MSLGILSRTVVPRLRPLISMVRRTRNIQISPLRLGDTELGTQTELEDMEKYRFSKLPLVKQLQDNKGLEVLVAGYSYDDLDRHGTVNIWKVASMFESIRLLTYGLGNEESKKDANYMWNHLRDRSCLLFLVSGHYELTPAFYKKNHYNNLLRFTDRLVNFGRSSCQHLTEAYCLETGELINRCITQIVHVDAKTRRPVAMPDRVVTTFGGATYPNERVTPLTAPSDSFVTSQTVHWSDTDAYRHTNQSRYLRFSHDGVAELCALGKLSKLTKDIGLYRIRTTRVLNQKETSPGDTLAVHTWEDGLNPMVVHSVLEKDGQSVFQCTFEFYEPRPDSHL